MDTLSYGYSKPENPDTGDVFFPALETNWQQVNDHAHNGVNSAPLSSQTVSIPSGSWADVAGIGGIYSQTVNLPTGFTFANSNIWIKDSSQNYVNLEIEYVSTSSFKVYSNNNAMTYTAYLK